MSTKTEQKKTESTQQKNESNSVKNEENKKPKENKKQEKKEYIEDEIIKEYKEFEDMGLKEDLLRGIFAYGYEKPSRIQQKAIVPLTQYRDRDLIAQAQSGTGKTGAFSISLLQNLDFTKNELQGLVLCNTRELAQQTQRVILAMGDYLKVKCHACVGGTRVKDDIQILKEGVHIVVGTPGRVTQMLNEGYMKPDKIKMLIIDEADEMLSFGFKDQIYEVFKHLPEDVQVALFSATMPNEVLEITEKFMRNPIRILVKKEVLTLEGLKQFYIAVEKEEYKLETLCDLYKTLTITQCVIFANSKKRVDYLAAEMNKRDFTVSSIHGDMSPLEREEVLKNFRLGKSRVLIATDVLSRGIDVHQVSLVINFDMPRKRETYIHRIGRSARYGRKGVAINFVTERDIQTLRELEKFYNTQIEEMPQNIADLI